MFFNLRGNRLCALHWNLTTAEKQRINISLCVLVQWQEVEACHPAQRPGVSYYTDGGTNTANSSSIKISYRRRKKKNVEKIEARAFDLQKSRRRVWQKTRSCNAADSASLLGCDDTSTQFNSNNTCCWETQIMGSTRWRAFRTNVKNAIISWDVCSRGESLFFLWRLYFVWKHLRPTGIPVED